MPARIEAASRSVSSQCSSITRRLTRPAMSGRNIETPMMDRFTGGDIQKIIDLEPVGRLGKPEESRMPCFG